MENRIIRRNEHKIFIIVFNDDKERFEKWIIILGLINNQKTSAIFNGSEKESDSISPPQTKAGYEK